MNNLYSKLALLLLLLTVLAVSAAPGQTSGWLDSITEVAPECGKDVGKLKESYDAQGKDKKSKKKQCERLKSVQQCLSKSLDKKKSKSDSNKAQTTNGGQLKDKLKSEMKYCHGAASGGPTFFSWMLLLPLISIFRWTF